MNRRPNAARHSQRVEVDQQVGNTHQWFGDDHAYQAYGSEDDDDDDDDNCRPTVPDYVVMFYQEGDQCPSCGSTGTLEVLPEREYDYYCSACNSICSACYRCRVWQQLLSWGTDGDQVASAFLGGIALNFVEATGSIALVWQCPSCQYMDCFSLSTFLSNRTS